MTEQPNPAVPPEQPQQPEQPAPQPEVRQAQPTAKFDTFQGTITEMDTHHRGLWEFKFKLDKPIHFTAGQYVSVVVPNHAKPAPFSIASSPEDHDTLDLGVEIVGEVTTAMSQLQPGDVVTLKGPFGNFVIPDTQRKVCFLAGGVGITPFMCMLRWIRDTSPDKHAVLFYSCKTKDQFMWAEELEEMHKSNANIKVVFTLTKEEPGEMRCETGRISEQMIREQLPDFKEYMFFSCGPPGLIDAMFQLLASMGVQQDMLKREAWH